MLLLDKIPRSVSKKETYQKIFGIIKLLQLFFFPSFNRVNLYDPWSCLHHASRVSVQIFVPFLLLSKIGDSSKYILLISAANASPLRSTAVFEYFSLHNKGFGRHTVNVEQWDLGDLVKHCDICLPLCLPKLGTVRAVQATVISGTHSWHSHVTNHW